VTTRRRRRSTGTTEAMLDALVTVHNKKENSPAIRKKEGLG
jgi:hypothetical protein